MFDFKTELNRLVDSFSIIASLPGENKHILVGLSGGPDSILTLHLANLAKQRFGFDIIVAHLNHQWRPEADSEEEFCKKVSLEKGLKFVSAKLSDFPVVWNGSKEDQARQARKLFFGQVVEQEKCGFVVLGHNLTDQIETFFIRLIRGSSLDGLSCMRDFDGCIFRPLLKIDKALVLKLCEDQKLEYCVDQSNNDFDFMRNKIRHSLLPVFIDVDSERAIQKLADTIDLLALENDYFKGLARSVLIGNIDDKGFFKISSFLALEKILAVRILKLMVACPCLKFKGHFSTGLFDEITRFLQQNKSRTHKIGTLTVLKVKSSFKIIGLSVLAEGSCCRYSC